MTNQTYTEIRPSYNSIRFWAGEKDRALSGLSNSNPYQIQLRIDSLTTQVKEIENIHTSLFIETDEDDIELCEWF